jgi:hypothetical protein
MIFSADNTCSAHGAQNRVKRHPKVSLLLLKLCPLAFRIRLVWRSTFNVQQAALSQLSDYTVPIQDGFYSDLDHLDLRSAEGHTTHNSWGKAWDISRLTAPQLSLQLSVTTACFALIFSRLPTGRYTHLQLGRCWGNKRKFYCFAKQAFYPLGHHVRIVFGMADDRHIVLSAVERIGTRSIDERMTSVI